MNNHVFYISLLRYDNIKKKQIDKMTTQLNFKATNNGKEYKVK